MSKYTCELCNKSFPTPSALSRHLNAKKSCLILKRVTHDKKLLSIISARDNFTPINIGNRLNSSTIIQFICNCGEKGTKSFFLLNRTGGFCCSCKEKIRQEKRKKTCIDKYGVDSPLKSETIQEKRKKTCIEKYGVDCAFKSETIKEKGKKTCIEKYGVSNVSQAPEIKQMKIDKSMQKYGVSNVSQAPEIKQMKIDKSMQKYGTEHVLQSDIVKQKGVETSIKKYGVSNPQQNPYISEKCSKKARLWKDYTLPDGNIIKIQGYENFALDILFREGYSQEDILTSRIEVPSIWYIDNEKRRRYFPDIYIKSINKIIEVKSSWTYKKKKII